MNIFFLDANSHVAATYLIDAHVGSRNCGGKMIVETCQMLANCYTAEQLADAPLTLKGTVRKHSHYNHPCSVWVRECFMNFEWLLAHGSWMVIEKVYRGGNYHSGGIFLDWCKRNPPTLPKGWMTSVPLVFPESLNHLKIKHDPVLSYQMFYVEAKRYDKNGKRMDNYTIREPAFFWEGTANAKP